MKTQEENKTKACLDCLENPEIALNNREEKERLSIAMSSYYMLYR
jgi:hypothetical protein